MRRKLVGTKGRLTSHKQVSHLGWTVEPEPAPVMRTREMQEAWQALGRSAEP